MVGLLLRFLNAPGIILITILGVAIQTSLFVSWPLYFVQPDVTLLIVVWCALRRPFVEGGILTLIVANIAEIHSASTQGMMMVSYIVVYLAVRMASRVLVIPDLASYVLVTMFASILWKFSNLGILSGLGVAKNQWRHTLVFLFPGALVEGALGFWFYRWLERFDWYTHKKAPAEQSVLGDPDQVGSGDYTPGYDEEMQMDGVETWRRPHEERRIGSRTPPRPMEG
jgi:hypothetical protein